MGNVTPIKRKGSSVPPTTGAHIDSALMRASSGGSPLRTDLSVTVFLSEPESYEGGELEINDGGLVQVN